VRKGRFGKKNFSTTRLVEELEGVVSSSNVDVSEIGREQHAHDESWHTWKKPAIVVHPSSTEEVAECVRLCSSNNVKMVPFGTGTGLEGGTNLGLDAVCFNLATNMNEIVNVNAEDFDCTIRPGVTRQGLNDELRHTGLWFPIDPGADASVCGMAATSASGTNAVRYGTMRENVLNLEVVLPSGEILHTSGQGGRARKTSAGLNLTNLFVGSEGTLGMITSATVRLHPVPGVVAAAICSFEDAGDAIRTSTETIQCGVQVGRVEFMDDVQVKASNAYSKLDLEERSTILFEFGGMSEESLQEQALFVEEIAKNNGGSNFRWATAQEDRANLWKARHAVYYANLAMRPGSRGLATDVCVPISELASTIVETKNRVEELGLLAPIVGHVGDGNFHCLIVLDPSDEEEVRTAKEFARWLGVRAIEAGGTCTGEHGVGRGKRDLLKREVGDLGIRVMKDLKSTLDPLNLMNPGVFFES